MSRLESEAVVAFVVVTETLISGITVSLYRFIK
jgi:hypothetical protein